MYEENQKLKTWITPDFATEYLAGAVLLGAAPCTAIRRIRAKFLSLGDRPYIETVWGCGYRWKN